MESKKYKSLIQNKAVLFSNPDDVKWLTKFRSSNMQIFLINDVWYALTDNRYSTAAKTLIKDMEILLMEDDAFKKVIIPAIQSSGGELIVDADFTPVGQFIKMKELLKDLSITLTPRSFVGLREIKTTKEINETKEAVRLTDELFIKLLDFIKVGMTEIEISNFIEKSIIDYGAVKSFDPIVAAGAGGAEPHHKVSDYEIQPGDMVTIDMGMHVNHGMCSDMTRTIAVGKLPEESEAVEIHQIVLDAMNKAIEAVKPGTTGAKLDKIARNYIADKGYGKYFQHGLGHGIGINIHEEPVVNKLGTNELEPGMLITIEPGIYIPNKYGVRIEQDVLVTKDGYEILNKSKTELLVI